MIPKEFITQVLERSDIAGIISEYVELEPAGNNLRGHCPFHKEKTPSFTVSAEKGIFKCFGCKKGGNIIQFIMDIEGISFPAAVMLLARKMGLEPYAGENEGTE